MAEAGEEKLPHRTCCCISHEFAKTASQNPNKIAVVHSTGGAQLCREFRTNNPNFNNSDHTLFHTHRISPTNPALQGDQYFTFSQLLASVQSLSSRIHNSIGTPRVYGIDAGDTDTSTPTIVVGIYMVPSVEYIVALLSVLRCANAAFLPLDPSWPKQRMLSIIASSKLSLIITCKTNTHQIDNSECLVDQTGCAVLEMSMTDNLDCSGSLDLIWPCQSAKMRKFCYVMYTSGSTGKPKGVCGTEMGGRASTDDCVRGG